MDNVQERVLDIRVRYDDAVRKIAEYRTQLDVLKKVEKTLKEDLEAGRISREKYNLKLSETKIAATENSEAVRVLNKEIQNNRKVEQEQEGSLKSLRAELSNLTKEYDSLSRAERNEAKGQELRDKINVVTNEIKNAEEETQRFYRNVGNYEDSVKGMLGSESKWYKSLQNISSMFGNGLGSAVKIAEQAVVSFGKTLLSLLANPIVLIIAGIAAALAALNQGISSSAANSAKLKEVMAPLKILMEAVTNVLIWMASKVLAFVEVGEKMVMWAMRLAEHLPLVGNAIKSVNDRIAENIEYQKLANQYARESREEIVKSAERERQVAELRDKVAQKDKYNTKERMAYLKQALTIEQDASAEKKRLATINQKLIEHEIEMGNKSGEALKRLAEAKAAVIEADTEYYKSTRRMQTQLANLTLEDTEKQKTAAEKAKTIREKQIVEIRKAEDEALKLVKDSRAKERQELNYQYDRQVEDLKRRLTTEKDLTKSARNAIKEQIVSIEKQKAEALTKLSDEYLSKEIADRQRLLENELASVKSGSEQEYQLKMQQLAAQRDAELAQKELTEKMKYAIQQKYNKLVDDLVVQHDNDTIKKQQDMLKLRFDTEIAEAYGNETEILRIKIEQKQAELDSLQQLEGESIEAFNLRKLEKQNEYIKSKEDLSRKEITIEQAKYDAMADVTNGLIALTQEIGESDRGFATASKILALAEIAINTGKAIAKMVSAESGKGIAGIATMASGIAAILSNIASAIKTVKSAKFAEGGAVTGPGTGTSDSIPAMLSNGESVLTASATSMFAPILSAFNQMGGGVPINITTTSNQAIGEEMLARAVAKGMMMAPAPVVSVEEYTSVSNRVKYLEDLGNV